MFQPIYFFAASFGFFLPIWSSEYVFYCMLQRIVSKVHLLTEGDWGTIHDFDLNQKSFWGSGDFRLKIQFRNSALQVLNATFKVERDRDKTKKRGGNHAVATAVNEPLNPSLESA